MEASPFAPQINGLVSMIAASVMNGLKDSMPLKIAKRCAQQKKQATMSIKK